MRIRVIGVGTRQGDDAAGLWAAERLACRPLPDGVEMALCERPGNDLLDAVTGADALVLLDATRPEGTPGTVRRAAPDALRRSERLSTHAISVAEGLALAEALGRLPVRVELIGIEAAELDGAPGEEPSEPVRRGVEEAVRLAGDLLDEMLTEEAADREAGA